MTELKPVWTEEDELEYQIGDMNGIAFVEQEDPIVIKKESDEKKEGEIKK